MGHRETKTFIVWKRQRNDQGKNILERTFLLWKGWESMIGKLSTYLYSGRLLVGVPDRDVYTADPQQVNVQNRDRY